MKNCKVPVLQKIGARNIKPFTDFSFIPLFISVVTYNNNHMETFELNAPSVRHMLSVQFNFFCLIIFFSFFLLKKFGIKLLCPQEQTGI